MLAIHFEPLRGGNTTAIQGAGAIADHVRHQVHFEKSEPQFLTRDHALGIDFRLGAFIGVAIAANAVAVLRADEAPCGHVIDFSGDIVQSHIEGAESTAEAALAGEVANAVEDRFDLEGIAADDVGLQYESHALIARVADLAQAVNALVGVYLNDGIVVIGSNADGTHVGDAQLTRHRITVKNAGLGVLAGG
jgi:hypothetical protein